MMQRFGARMESFGHALPPKAQEMQVRLREEKARREEAGIEETRRKGEELSRREEERRERGLLEKVWMGDEGEDWKEKRDRREKEALEGGRGYWDLITEQVWEVWNGERRKVEEIKEIDVEVVRERKEGKVEGKK